MPEESRWCPSCGAEYLAHVTTCPDCGVPVGDAPPPPPPPADHGTTSYDLSDATGADRDRVELVLRGAGITFSWEDDGTLVVPRTAEAAVDELLAGLDLGDAEDLTDQELDRLAAVHVGADTLERLGTGLYVVGGIGVGVAVVQMMSGIDTLEDFDQGSGLQKAAYVLGSYTFVLFSALVIAAGALCRFWAAWVRLRLDTAAPGRP